jgi:hypothetical protein
MGTMIQILENFEETLNQLGFECASAGCGSSEYTSKAEMTQAEMDELLMKIAGKHIRIMEDVSPFE